MKVLVVALCFLIFGCEDYPKYKRWSKTTVPDSLKDKHATFIIETTRAASFHITGGDYEDPEDVINTASLVFQSIYQVEVDGLLTIDCHGCYGKFTPENQLTPRQRKIYNELINK